MHGTIQSFPRARVVRRDDSWTYRETEVLREHWPDMAAIRKMLPYRTERAIGDMARKCGVAPQRTSTSGQEQKTSD